MSICKKVLSHLCQSNMTLREAVLVLSISKHLYASVDVILLTTSKCLMTSRANPYDLTSTCSAHIRPYLIPNFFYILYCKSVQNFSALIIFLTVEHKFSSGFRFDVWLNNIEIMSIIWPISAEKLGN